MRQAEFAIVLQDNLDNQVGHIIGHGLDKLGYKKGIMFKIIQILYLDEGAFIFESQTFLIKGVNIIHLHFKKIGMEMHVGRNEKASKTECIMFSPPRCFNPKIYRRRKRASAPPPKRRHFIIIDTYKSTNSGACATRFQSIFFRTEGIIFQKEEEEEKEETL